MNIDEFQESNVENFEKKRRAFDKSLIIELNLRGGALVSGGNQADSNLY